VPHAVEGSHVDHPAAGAPRGGPGGGLRDAVRMALGTLTALPVRPPRRLDGAVPGRAMLLAPAAGLVPGLAALAVVWLAGRAGLAPLLAAALGVGVLALATRGLHLDGLADTADGLAASYDRDRALAVMRRGDVGPAGLATVVLVLLVQVSALAQAVAATGSATVLLAAVAARTAVPLACTRGIPAARPDGLGSHVAGSVTPARLAVCAAATAAALAATAAATGAPWWLGPAATAAALAAAAVVLWRAVRRIGGMTGDVAGAAVEVATAAALVTLAGTAG
jgi:adenosylcobinamide-GDP ribazoletransferase